MYVRCRGGIAIPAQATQAAFTENGASFSDHGDGRRAETLQRGLPPVACRLSTAQPFRQSLVTPRKHSIPDVPSAAEMKLRSDFRHWRQQFTEDGANPFILSGKAYLLSPSFQRGFPKTIVWFLQAVIVGSLNRDGRGENRKLKTVTAAPTTFRKTGIDSLPDE